MEEKGNTDRLPIYEILIRHISVSDKQYLISHSNQYLAREFLYFQGEKAELREGACV